MGGGGLRAAGGLGRHLAAFWEAGACGEHPQSPRSRAVVRMFRGPSPDDTRKNHRGEVSGLPVVLQREVRTVPELCVPLFSLCVYVWEGDPGGARFVLVAGGVGFLGWQGGAVCSGN